jgi:hypothetical protein
LAPATFALCFLAGSISFFLEGGLPDDFVPRRLIPTALLLFFGLALVVVYRADKTADYLVVADAALAPSRIRRQHLRATVLSEYRPRWASAQLALSPLGARLTVCDEGAVAQEKGVDFIGWEYRLSLPQNCQAQANIHYFPGWTILDNGQILPGEITSQGFMRFALGPGEHLVRLVFRNTPVRVAGNVISGLGLLVLFGLVGQGIRSGQARPRERSGRNGPDGVAGWGQS